MERSTVERLSLGGVLLLVLFLGIAVLIPARGNGKPPDYMRYKANLQSWIYGTYQTIKDTGSLPSTYHVLHVSGWVEQYPSQLMPYGRANSIDYKAVRDSQITTFGPFKYEQIQAGEVEEDQLLAVAEKMNLSAYSWEYVDGFWFSRTINDWMHGGSQTILAMGRVPEIEGETWCFLGRADGFTYASPANQQGRIEKALDQDRRARERLNLAPLPPEFRSWLLTGEPASVGDGTFVPPKLEQ